MVGTSSQKTAKEDKEKCCDICKMSEKNELFYGEFIEKAGFKLHYYCLLSGTRMLQLSKSDKYGIYGFLPGDIRSGINQIQDKICYYCQKVRDPYQ